MKHSREEVIAALAECSHMPLGQIPRGPLPSYSMLIRRYNLQYRHHNDSFIFLTADAGQDGYIVANMTQYWYRAMTSDEWSILANCRQFHGDSFGGIAPNREYVRQYFNRASTADCIVQFNTPGKGFLYHEFTENHGWQIKGEGGGTYGLGPTGIEGGAAGRLFNEFLQGAVITWNIVDLKIQNTLR